MVWLRSKAFDIFFVGWTGLFGLAIPLFWLTRSEASTIRAATRLWVRGTLYGLQKIVGLKYDERGREHIPAEPCLIVANHQSTWETLASLVLFPDVAIVAKQELLSIPIFGWYLRKSAIVIDRESGSKALRDMINQGRGAIAQGRCVLIFPEGTRREATEPVIFKRGVEMLYARLGVSALPVAIDSGRFWGPGKAGKRSGVITVTYLEHILPGLSGAEFVSAAEARIEAARAERATAV